MLSLGQDALPGSGAATTLSDSAYHGGALWPMVRLFHVSVSDVSHALSYAPQARLVAWFAVPLAIASVFGGFVAGFFGWSTGLLHLLGLYLIVERLSPYLRALAVAQTSCGPENTRRVSLTTTEVVVDSQIGSTGQGPFHSRRARWDSLAGYYLCPQGLMLVLPDKHQEFLPRIWFSAQEFECLLELVKSKAPRPRRALLASLRPPLVTVLLVVAWVAYETPWGL